MNKKVPLKKWMVFCKCYYDNNFGGAHGVMVIVIGNGHGDMSSNSGRDW